MSGFKNQLESNITLNGRSYKTICSYCNVTDYFKSALSASRARAAHEHRHPGCGGVQIVFLTVAQVNAEMSR